jgi:hypothetical protein
MRLVGTMLSVIAAAVMAVGAASVAVGKGAAAGHAPSAPHPVAGNMGNSCDLPSCRGGGGRSALIQHYRDLTVVRHAPAKQYSSMTEWRHPCKEPTCHHHHHHYYYYYNNFPNYGVYTYEPEPECWRWSRRLHRWVWVCGPPYPGY